MSASKECLKRGLPHLPHSNCNGVTDTEYKESLRREQERKARPPVTHPTPWKAERFSGGVCAIYDVDGVMVESVYDVTGRGDSRDARALAERIVTAVNHYDSVRKHTWEPWSDGRDHGWTCTACGVNMDDNPIPREIPPCKGFQPQGLGNERTQDMGGNAHSTEVKVETEDATTTVSTPDEASTSSTSEESTDSSSDSSTDDSASDESAE